MSDRDSVLAEINELVEHYLVERESELIERLRGHEVAVRETYRGYDILIEGNRLHVWHDKNRHRYTFLDEDYSEFFTTSEKKGEEILKFMRAVAKLLSPRSTAASEDFLDAAHADPEELHEEILGDDAQ